MSFDGHVYAFLLRYALERIAGHRATLCPALEGTTNGFLKEFCQFTLPAVAYEGPRRSVSAPTLDFLALMVGVCLRLTLVFVCISLVTRAL